MRCSKVLPTERGGCSAYVTCLCLALSCVQAYDQHTASRQSYPGWSPGRMNTSRHKALTGWPLLQQAGGGSCGSPPPPPAPPVGNVPPPGKPLRHGTMTPGDAPPAPTEQGSNVSNNANMLLDASIPHPLPIQPCMHAPRLQWNPLIHWMPPPHSHPCCHPVTRHPHPPTPHTPLTCSAS